MPDYPEPPSPPAPRQIWDCLSSVGCWVGLLTGFLFIFYLWAWWGSRMPQLTEAELSGLIHQEEAHQQSKGR